VSRAPAALPPQLARLRRGARRRAAAIQTALWLPPLAAVCVLLDRFAAPAIAIVMGVALLLAGALAGWLAMRIYDARWVVRRLNAVVPAFEDSLDLLQGGPPSAAASAGLGALAALQRRRLQVRLTELALPDLRPMIPGRRLAIVWSGAALTLLLGLQAPALWASLRPGAASGAPPTRSGPLLAAHVRVEPPAYTGLAIEELRSLDAKVAEGSKISFRLEFAADTVDAALEFLDGSRLQLRHDAGYWNGERVMQSSSLLRLQIDPAPVAALERLYRIDVIKDRAPEVRVLTPERTLNLLERGQKTWDLAFEASDDYGLGPAVLSVAMAQGSGEQIKTTQQTLVLAGDGDARRRVYRKRLDLDALGFGEGDDLVVRLSVSDNRPGQPNQTQSASFILRWPAPLAAAGSGIESLAEKALPAYFSSERQIIIDSEALQADRGNLSAARFGARSDELGVEQRTLRLRYGEFLGEEADAGSLRDDDAASVAGAQPFGVGADVASQFGHMHDKPEAATLLDADTRRLLKAALGEMWQAELHLRQSNPERALPFEYKALEYIKQVQQAERIYLARVGVQMPAVDAARRLSGDRTGLSDREIATPAGAAQDTPLVEFWQALDGDMTPQWAPFEGWVRSHQSTLPDALGLLSAIDRLQRDPRCTACRGQLRALLWPLLPPSATALRPRSLPDAAGSAYLRALAAQAGTEPRP
jgi:hypothetical protein